MLVLAHHSFRFCVLLTFIGGLLLTACNPDPEPEPEPEPTQSYAGLIINEFLALNDSCCADPQGDFDDWVELYNSSTEAIDIGGIWMTDTPGDASPYQIPSTNSTTTTIPSGGYLIIWWDDDQMSGPLHISKKLSASGESIVLLEPDGITTIDSYAFGQQTSDVSTGRSAANREQWVTFETPTPGEANQ
ncbi:MAG: lamin tail domain-containing protein [Bacteroidota bacterium]